MNIQYRNTALTAGETFPIERLWHPTVDAWNPLYQDITQPFNFHKYTCPRLPVSLGQLDVALLKQCPSVLRVPIKNGRGKEIRLPKELLPIKPILVRLLQYDYYINPNFQTFHAHITIDNSAVKPNTTQRFGGFHGDGLQGGKFKQKLVVEHSYIFVDKFPTEVALQPFFVAHLNEDRYNIFKEFDKQVKRDLIYHLRPSTVYLIDPYVVHASPVITEQTERTFFRLTLTPAELLMPKNTVNPMFEGQHYDDRIDVRDFVSEPDIAVPLDFYGLGQ